jgi:RecJ-like exonuclease|tara:strand:+ start:340 stop:561 length:222 start_codon:yes stop_codon:yes gene_type:complete
MYKAVDCPVCQGSGGLYERVYVQTGPNPEDYDIDGDVSPCETCNATGKISQDFADYIKRTSRITPTIDAEIPF